MAQRLFPRIAWLAAVVLLLEASARFVFPRPEIDGFNRIAYSPLLSSAEGGSSRPLMNAAFSWSSALDHAESIHNLNLYGFRDRQWSLKKRSGTRRLLFVGDSYVEGFMAAANETVPAVFQSLADRDGLRVEAMSLGVGAAGAEEYGRLIRDAIPLLRPDDVFLVFYTNDLPAAPLAAEWLARPCVVQRRPWWEPRIAAVLRSIREGAPVPRRWHAPPFAFLPSVPDRRNPWTERQFPFIDAEIAGAMRTGRFNPYLINQLQWQESRLKRPSGVSGLLEALDGYVLAGGARLHVAYVPYHCLTSDRYVPFHRRLNEPTTISSLMREEYRLHERELAETCRRLGVGFLSLTPFLRAAEARRERMYWEYDEHMRPAGYRLVAEELYSFWRSPSGARMKGE